MRLPFYNRQREIVRLTRALSEDEGNFVVIYGRRRCGKSTLIRHILREGDTYHLADQRETGLQIQSLAQEVARVISGFDEVIYPSWESFFTTFKLRAKPGIALFLDEFPYLVQAAPELPSLVQKFVDDTTHRLHLVICGSSQRMMQGLVMDASAPLYGRATEIMRITPLKAGWITEALQLQGIDAIESYSVWGGVPRYWELVRSHSSFEEAVKELVLDRDGVLHREPSRILFDDIRNINQASSILSLVATGCHRLSEVATRLGKPATSLTRPLSHLIELGYIKKDQPFGENPRSSKKSLYKVNDPFLLFWYRYILPNQSLLEADLIDPVYDVIRQRLSEHVSGIWEELACASIAHLPIADIQWKPAQRWWGKGRDGKPMELDVVSESMDGSKLLIGEVKWENKTNADKVYNKLIKNIENLPLVKGREVIPVLWLKNKPEHHPDIEIITPNQVLNCLK